MGYHLCNWRPQNKKKEQNRRNIGKDNDQQFSKTEKRHQPTDLRSSVKSKNSKFKKKNSVQSLSHVQLLMTPWMQHARPPCPSPIPGVYPNSCPLSQWRYPAISPSVLPFSSCPQSLPASGSFPVNQLFAWGGQSIGVSASASVLSVNTQDWSALGWTGWISLQSKGLSRGFYNTTVQKHQFFGTHF